MSNAVNEQLNDTSEKKTGLCKCGKKADFIKDYWVTESKTLKEKAGEDVHVTNIESVCGILRRRYCSSCLSRIAGIQRATNRRLNTKIFIPVFIALIVGLALNLVSVIVFNDMSKSAIITVGAFAVMTVGILTALLVTFALTQGKRKKLENGDFSNIKAVDTLLDSLNFGLEDPKKVAEIPSIDVISDGDGRVNYDMERSGYNMKVIHNGKISLEPMRQRILYPFKDDCEYIKRTYVNAGLLEDNIRSIDARELTENDFDIKGETLMRYSGLSVEVLIPEKVTKIAEQAFKKSKNCEKIIIPKGVTEIGREAFLSCPATEIELPPLITKIPSFAFYMSAIREMVIPEGVTEIEDNAFGECYSLERVVLPSTCTKVGEAAFKGCSSLTEVVTAEGIESFGDYCFNGCRSLKVFTAPEGCYELGNFCFEGCSELTEMYIPETLQFVGGRVFEGATKMSIYGAKGSQAEKLADELRVRFTSTDAYKFVKNHGARRR